LDSIKSTVWCTYNQTVCSRFCQSDVTAELTYHDSRKSEAQITKYWRSM